MTPIESIDFKTIALLSAEQAHRYKVIPSHTEGGMICMYSSAGHLAPKRELEFLLGKKVELHALAPSVFDRHLARYYPYNKSNRQLSKTKLSNTRDESDIVRFVRKVMEDAAAMGASDIHIERYETYARIRFRWEGQLVEKYEVPLAQYNAVVSRIKILSELDISERRLPQDGRIQLSTKGQKIDLRVSTIPGRFGEKVVLRLLRRSSTFLQLENLGMQSGELNRFQSALLQPNGMVLITGPTGSGKTTTLYALLSKLNQPDVNINTIEDPIEYNLEGINQVQVKEEIGLSFSHALRAFLRQDPNIIMVGEIRDRITAEVAIQAALTGHLVFSTLHTNSAWDSVGRLLDMGVEAYLLASVLRLTAAQRLLRVLCEECRTVSPSSIPPHLAESFRLEKHWFGAGCPACHYTGYRRRVAIYEAIPMDRELGNKLRSVDLEIGDYLQKSGIQTLRDHVATLVREGKTSLKEALTYLIS